MPKIELPILPNSPVWKLCPKCNDKQLGDKNPCKNCAWRMCGIESCADIFPCKQQSADGSLNHIPLVVEIKAYWQIMPMIIKWWGIYYFATESDARAAADKIITTTTKGMKQ